MMHSLLIELASIKIHLRCHSSIYLKGVKRFRQLLSYIMWFNSINLFSAMSSYM